ncbi:transcriptional regulator [Flavilitoribacter nigricans DSM 23189 = NBRC 102662]|uniref:Transcriptional regulator n=2 Tax=Flavilitoribacter TaxID=2762562 RepID=A0A2D0NIY5_FLAN2|nr:transcriptional regulator [Flavilitoribacter nigricans DSM 23189 = NBRC 102662]
MIGHQLLLCLGDKESRVLPIRKIDERYKISFEREFGMDPDDIAKVINRVMAETQTSTRYLVEVEQCTTEEVVHVLVFGSSSILPCGGRDLPEDCYSFFITLLDELEAVESSETAALSSDHPSLGPPETSPGPLRSALLMVPIFLLIGFLGYLMRKKDPLPSDPNLIPIGASQFDKKNMTLTFDGQTVELSNKETELLLLLHTHANEPVEREILLQKVWGDEGDYVGRTLDVFISKLRKKLEADDHVKIVNIRAVGYKLIVNAPA